MEKQMENQEMFRLFDHTLLDVTATIDDVTKLCGEAVKYGVATVCVPPCYVKQASQFIGKANIGVCTVIGYPHGYSTTDTKIFESKNAVKNGADELEIYANIGYIKKRQYNEMQLELSALRKICKNKILKLIIDTSILNPDEQIAVCTIATSAQIDYISITSKADFEELVAILKRLKDGLGERARIKISGDITTITQAELLRNAGANRIGESKVLGTIDGAYFEPIPVIAPEQSAAVETKVETVIADEIVPLVEENADNAAISVEEEETVQEADVSDIADDFSTDEIDAASDAESASDDEE